MTKAMAKGELESLALGYSISSKMSDEEAKKLGRFIVEQAAIEGGSVDLPVTIIKSDEKGCCVHVCIMGHCFCAVPC